MTTMTAGALDRLEEAAVLAARPRHTSPLMRPDQAADLARSHREAVTRLQVAVSASRLPLRARVSDARQWARGYGRAYVLAALEPGVTPLRLLRIVAAFEIVGLRGALLEGTIAGLADGWADRRRREERP